MLPDFPEVKARLNQRLLRWVQRQIPVAAPILQGVSTVRQHEGQPPANSPCPDEQEEPVRTFSGQLELTRDEMKRFDFEDMQRRLTDVADQLGQDQARELLSVAKRDADRAGNVVHSAGELTQDEFLNAFGRIPQDFDPQTLAPKPGLVSVMHPDTAAVVLPKLAEWDKDPAFRKKHDRIMAKKREAWRDREAGRKLVD